jgi:hypothetical protein
MVSYPLRSGKRSGKGPHDIATVDVLGRIERGGSSFLRRRQQKRRNAAIARPAIAAPMAIPMMAPVGRPVLWGVAVEVDVTVAVAVDVNNGGRDWVGGILIDEHAVRFEERQQNDVAFGDVWPQ